MMIPGVKQINDLLWRSHRRGERLWLSREVGQWGLTRAPGRSRYVRRRALGWGLSAALAGASLYAASDWRLALLLAVPMIPMCVFLGWWEAAGEWAENERLYERSLRDSLVGGECHALEQSTTTEA
jgi:hypothetical protein